MTKSRPLSKSLTKFLIVVVALVIFITIGTTHKAVFGLENYHQNASSVTHTSAECMAVLEVSTGRVLYSKNMHKQKAPASTTKILTAIVVIENTLDLDKKHKIPDSAVGVEGSSIYLAKGESLSIRDLLYGLMLQSGNDCAESLAIITAGSKEKFAVMMNETAKRVGAKNSNFVTSHGLDAEGHYTTAYDLAIISCYALRNPIFAEIASTKKYSCEWEGRDYSRVILNKNRLLNSFEGADGVKTGYTKKAGRTFVASATRNDMQVVCAVLNCGPMFEDSARLLNSAFNEFCLTGLGKIGEKVADLNVTNSRTTFVGLAIKDIGSYPLRQSELEKIEIKISKLTSLTAPIKEGDIIGSAEFYLENQLIHTSELVIMESADSLNLVDRLKDIASRWNK